MKYSLLVFALGMAFFFYFKDGRNYLYRVTNQMVPEEGILQELERANPSKVQSVCKLEMDFDFICAPAESPPKQQQPIYLWGRPGTKNPRVATAQECAEACKKFGAGYCVWRENGDDFGGATSCSFVSEKICSNSSLASVPQSNYSPVQVKKILSGKCE